MDEPITALTIIAAVRSLAEAYPDGLYQKPEGHPFCHNERGTVKHGPPNRTGCIIGQVLLDAGFRELQAWSVRTILNRHSVPRTNQQVEWLSTVQRTQDGGHRWAACISRADQIAPLDYKPPSLPA